VKRIGLFGGTFNPIHLGHLRTAVEVGEKLNLDSVYLIPSALPPHKDSHALISAEDRLAMARIAVEGSGLFQVSDVELRRSGPSYTIDTVRHFKSRFGDAALFWIVGSDAFLELDTWKDYQALLDEIAFVVMTRPGFPDGENLRDAMDVFIRSKISGGYRSEASGYFHSEKKPILPVRVSLIEISSSRMRELIRAGRSIDFMAPEKVLAFIKEKRLYL